MGCNTSKESVQPVEGEDKTEEKTEDKVEGEPAATDDKQQEGKQEEKQQEEQDSVKESISLAVTLKTPTPVSESARSGERLSNHLAASTPEPPACPEDDSEDSEVAAAAVKIQAAFRGHQSRRTMKQAQQPQPEPEPTREQLEAEFRADDAELCKAATTIQNSFRNHLKAKGGEGEKEGEGSAGGKDEKKEEEELDIDLTDPDLNKAATKIQASFRGHKVRKETDPVPGAPGAPVGH